MTEKAPVVILQRSKPVAYIVDAESYQKMQNRLYSPSEQADAVLREIDVVRDKIAKETGAQPDSTQLVRDLRSGKQR